MSHQPFLNSMTFAAATCSCDECGIPNEILEAARKHKRKATHNYGTNKRIMMEQQRELVGRFRGYSVWKFVLGWGGDPIVELRNSWRIIFVQELSEEQSTAVYSIGRGIIGSAAEEADRNPTNWKRGSAYFLPLQKDTGCGWICSQTKETSNEKTDETVAKLEEPDDNAPKQIEESTCGTRTGEHIGATLYILKANANSIDEDVSDAPSWVVLAKEQFKRSIEAFAGKAAESNLQKPGMEGIHLTTEESIKVRSVVEEVLSLADGNV